MREMDIRGYLIVMAGLVPPSDAVFWCPRTRSSAHRRAKRRRSTNVLRPGMTITFTVGRLVHTRIGIST